MDLTQLLQVGLIETLEAAVFHNRLAVVAVATQGGERCPLRCQLGGQLRGELAAISQMHSAAFLDQIQRGLILGMGTKAHQVQSPHS